MKTLLLSLLLAVTPALAQQDPLAGSWTYRSFHNKPGVMIPDDDHAGEVALSLIFGEGVITLDPVTGTKLTGKLDLGPGYALNLEGTASGTPLTVQLVGTGRAGTATAGWEYRYLCFLVPPWPGATRQVPALVGSLIRAKPHGNSPAGYTASFIAVKRPQ